MIIVVDTNVLLVSISSKSKYHWLYQLILTKRIQIAYTNEILTEYEEQLSLHWHPEVAINVIRSITELSNAILTTIFYNLRLIDKDEDDNKFVDCAFAANADFIVTNDSHFNILKHIGFPSIPILSIDEFEDLLKKSNTL
ncbi:putative toxin-antitoxin system toxin component, PIN family [Mucilaginibacter ginsenosidivorans]|uniref:Putative toxin-antitoxin system toxin component, PIN family n=1 Tax=Mucilaginibacter ginsenosidivorans TaxID=398053 RepID=A0A5B8UV14_9SPHI|nr:putative toxin-antitoxin system toxin component, PIN family [Mucilaginibacter ginsenosidivorans]